MTRQDLKGSCVAFLHRFIKENGAIPFGQYMDIALSHPQYGYYMTRDPFGQNGDFITAPEVSQMFGEVVGAWVIDVWMQMGEPSRFSLIECGAGRGTLMRDILGVASKVEVFQKSVDVFLVDTSPALRTQQKKTLSGFDNITFVESIDDVQCDGPCIILGNEFLDALSVEQLRRCDNGWEQKYVARNDDGFYYEWRAASQDLLELLPQKTVSNEIYEVSPARIDFIKKCCDILCCNGGAALFIDYGFRKRTFGDTVQAVKRHGFCDALSDSGRADITSHVDFAALLDNVCVYESVISERIVTQRAFLLQLGIEYRAKYLAKATLENNSGHNIMLDLQRLIGTDNMGDLFKVMCFHSGYNFNLAGFQ